MAVIKFMIGNLKKRKSYSIVICVLVFLAGLLLTVTASTSQRASSAYDQAFNSIEGPHILYWFQETDFKPEFQKWYEKQPEVQSVKILKTKSYNGAVLEHEGKKMKESSDYDFFVYNPADHMKLIDAIYSSEKTLSKGELYLPYIFKTEYDLMVGDKVDYIFGAQKMIFKIAGFIEDPLYGGDLVDGKSLFVSNSDLLDLQKLGDAGLTQRLQMRVRLNSYSESTEYNLSKRFMKEYGSSIGYVNTYSEMKNWHLTLPKIALVVMIAFACILCVITLTILRYAILATIEADYLNIGIIKAMGFTPFMVQIAITGQYILLVLITSILSLVAGIFITPLVGSLILKSSGLYFSGELTVVIGIIMILILTTVISTFSYVTARRTKRISPVRAIANGTAPVYFSSRLNIRLERLGFLPFDVRMALKQVLTKSKRYILLTTISALLVFALVFLLGLVQTFNSEKAINMIGGELSDIELDAKTRADADSILANIKKDYEVQWMTYQETEQLDIDDERTGVRIKQDFDATGELTTLSGRHPKHDNEIAISSLLKKRSKKGIGDYVTIKDKKGMGHQFLITGIFQTIDEGGVYARMLESGMKVLDPGFEMNEVYIKLKSHDNIDGVITEMKGKYVGFEEISNEKKQTTDNIVTMQSVFSAISKLVFVFTMIMISVITLLIMRITVYSETSELGIFKALGFSSARIRWQLMLRFVIVTMTGGVIGVVLESLTGSQLFSIALRGIGISSLKIEFNVFNATIPVVAISLLAMVSAYVSSQHIKRVSAYALINE